MAFLSKRLGSITVINHNVSATTSVKAIKLFVLDFQHAFYLHKMRKCLIMTPALIKS